MLDIFSVAVVVIRGLALMMFASAISLIPTLWIEVKQAATGAQAYDSFTDSSFTAAVVVYAVPTLVKFLTVAFISAAGNERGASFPSVPPKPEAIVEVVTQISLGLWLLLGSEQLAASCRRILIKLKGAFGAE